MLILLDLHTKTPLWTVSVPFAIGAFARMEKSGLGVPVAAGYTRSVWRMFSWMTTVKKDFAHFV